MSALFIALLLIVYPNRMAMLSARRTWDQWRAFTIGNVILGFSLLAIAGAGGLLPTVWGSVSGGTLLLGVVAGCVPLAVIVTLMFVPGQLGRDIVASGLGDVSTRRFLYRVGVEVSVATVICEELAFRGVLYVLLVRVTPVPWAVALDAITFGLWHVALQYNGFSSQRGLARWAATVGGTLVYTGLGVLLVLVRQATGGLLPAIVAHGLLDAGMFAGMFVRRRQFMRRAPERSEAL